LAILAWAHPEGKEIFSVEDMIRVFDLTQIQTTAPVFDLEKLRWMNGEYIRAKTNDELESLLIDFGALKKGAADDVVKKVLPLVKERIKTLGEFAALSEFFFKRPKKLERKLDAKRIALVREALSASEWTHGAMEAAIRAAADKEGEKAKDVFMELRVAVTGSSVGPPLLESLEVLGREETLARLSS
jgi:glutamyl-tRNA synthetase